MPNIDAAFVDIVAHLMDVRLVAALLTTMYPQPTINHVHHTFMIAATSRS